MLLLVIVWFFVRFDMSNALQIFARELRANLISVKFQIGVFIAFSSCLNAFYSW